MSTDRECRLVGGPYDGEHLDVVSSRLPWVDIPQYSAQRYLEHRYIKQLDSDEFRFDGTTSAPKSIANK